MLEAGRSRERRIANESIRLFFEVVASERFQIYLPTLGAGFIGFEAWRYGGVPATRIAPWFALVAAAETALNGYDKRWARASPSEGRFLAWAWTKTALTALFGFAVGLGPIVLHSPGVALCTILPAWASLIVDAGLIYVGAAFMPCTIVAMSAATLPPALWLLGSDQEIDRLTAFTLLVALPFTLVFGSFAARNLRSLVIGRIEIADLLEREHELLNRVQDAQADRSRFYSAASHDLRQPLQALGFYVSLLSSADDRAQRDEIELRLVECVEDLDRQFDAIIGTAQADHAAQKAAPVPIALQGVLERATARAAHRAMTSGLRLSQVKTSQWAIADPDLLERALGNLVANALRYTKTGGVALGVRRSGDDISVCVADSGIGISCGERERIFEDFYQVGNSERNRAKGFGLGLAIVRRLCTVMGWRVEVRSRVGHGSVFSIVLPRAEPTASRARARAEALAPQRDLPDRLVVLLVEDDARVRDATTRVLERWGVRVELRESGEEALAALARRESDEIWHVLVDHRLIDGESGLDVARTMLASPEGPPHLCLLTGETDEAVLAQARALGIRVVRKPLKPMQLRALLSAPSVGRESSPKVLAAEAPPET